MTEAITFITAALQILSFALLLAGAAYLHLRLRRLSSLSFILSSLAILAWIFWGMLTINRLLDIQVVDDPPMILFNFAEAHLIAPAIDALLGFWFCASLFFHG
ncbi:MAG: hypothetical protein NVV60_11880 [Luteimonas sp.]|nr:hypothetical protein [Luteimonas sp.]